MRPRLYAYYIVVAIVLLAGVYVLKKKSWRKLTSDWREKNKEQETIKSHLIHLKKKQK